MSQSKETERIVLSTDEGIVEYRTDIEGWVGKDGLYYGRDENRARRANSTHSACETCWSVVKMGWTRCNSCIEKCRYESYLKLEKVEYTGEPVFLWDGTEYFYDEDQLIDYLEDNGLEEVELIVAEPRKWRELSADYWSDQVSDDDDDYPEGLLVAIDNFNKAIGGLGIAHYSSNGDKRTSYKLTQND